MRTAQAVRTLRGHEWPVHWVAYSPEGDRPFSAGEDGTIRIWQLERLPTPVVEEPLAQPPAVRPQPPAAPTPVVQAEGGVRTLTGHSGPVLSVALSPDGTLAVTGGEDCTVRPWDAATGRCRRAFRQYDKPVSHVEFASGGAEIEFGSEDGPRKLWDPVSGQSKRGVGSLLHDPSVLAFSPQAGLAALEQDGAILIAGLREGGPPKKVEIQPAEVVCAAFPPGGDRIVFGCADKTLKVCEVATRRFAQTLSGHLGAVNAMDFSPPSSRKKGNCLF